MAVLKNDVIRMNMNDMDMQECISNAQILCETMKDRSDLHLRSYMERYIDILMGEVAEKMVINWLHDNGKYAISAVNKKSGKPDLGHDIIVMHRNGSELKCSIKSSLSVYKSDLDDILDNFTMATKATEIRNINIQVYYWLSLKNYKHRITVPSTDNMAIIGWTAKNDIKKFSVYNGEERQVADIKLREVRSMRSLLPYLQ